MISPDNLDRNFTIAELNQLSQADFVAVLGEVFEATPAIADQAWHRRPFIDRADLHQRMVEVVQTLDQAQQMALIRAHPDLGSKAKMAEASVQEQAGVGLDRLSPADYDRFQSLNAQYKQQFEFPFIIAVKHQTQASILEAFERRLQNTLAQEQAQALAEICQIARFRLEALVS
jgi:2-oxo-4-hydroxy-4-carboxy-5-ureidoimidazoline decarboxylase